MLGDFFLTPFTLNFNTFYRVNQKTLLLRSFSRKIFKNRMEIPLVGDF
jgi:hypothetical protein